MSLKRDLLTPVLTGILAILVERWIYNHSEAVRALVGPEPPR